MADIKTETKPAVPSTISMDDIINKLIPAVVAATAKSNQAPAPQARPNQVQYAKCSECGQVKDNGTGGGCQGKHVLAVVYPTRYPQHADYFPGAIINGVRYLSNNSTHRVLVPEEAESTIMGIVNGFEQNEQDMAVGRKREHHSGSMSPHGSSVVPATAGWR